MTRAQETNQPALRCWFCDLHFHVALVRRDGVIRSRSDRNGGPFHLLTCPECGRENMCERSRRGRWFSSPPFRVSLLDYLFNHLFDLQPESFLAAASWYKEHEKRRRYFFERDGDSRYSSERRRWHRLFSTAKGDHMRAEMQSAHAEPTGDWTRRRARSQSQRATSGEDGEDRRRADSGERRKRQRPRSPIVKPSELLGVPPDADVATIHAAFHRLALQYHPDKVHHRGEEFVTHAQEKFKRLKEAYERLLLERDE